MSGSSTPIVLGMTGALYRGITSSPYRGMTGAVFAREFVLKISRAIWLTGPVPPHPGRRRGGCVASLSGIGGVETGFDAAEFILLGSSTVQVGCSLQLVCVCGWDGETRTLNPA